MLRFVIFILHKYDLTTSNRARNEEEIYFHFGLAKQRFFDVKNFRHKVANISIKTDGNDLLLVRIIHHGDHLAVLIRLTLVLVC